MPRTGETRRPIEQLLVEARIALDEGWPNPPAAERIARHLRREQQRDRTTDTRSTSGTNPAATPHHEPDQFAHDLNLACSLVLAAEPAANQLTRLAETHSLEPGGALVFGCLLHLTGRTEAGRFWWQFAAGSGNHTAAYCLYLHHGRYAEYRDAEFWRGQARELREVNANTPRPTLLRATLLPKHVVREIIAQCYYGTTPHLPLQAEAAVNQLHVECDDEDFGEIPQPSTRLPELLTTRL